MMVLESENLEIKEKLKKLSKKCSRGKDKASNLQFGLETS